MLKFIGLIAVLMMPLTVNAADYDPTAPSKPGQAAANAAKESILPAPVKTPPKIVPPQNNSMSPIPTSGLEKFEYHDTDGSGTLSYKEFMRYSGRTEAQSANFRKRFLRMDANGDYQITLKELKNWEKNP